jgi:hypothetical protein
MTILRIEVCQICHEIGKPIQKYRIGDAVHLFRLPLCDDCVKTPFSDLLAARPRRRTLAANVPTTMEQVAAAKRASPRKAKQRTARKRS